MEKMFRKVVPKVPQLVVKYLVQTGSAKTYGLVWLLITIIDIIQKTLMSNLLSGDEATNTLRHWIVCLSLLQPLMQYWLFGRVLTKINSRIISVFWRCHLEEYDHITMKDKNSFTIKDLQNKLRGFEFSLIYWLDNGFPSVVGLLTMTYMALYTFYKNSSWILFIALVIGNCIIYFLVKKKLDNCMLKEYRSGQKRRDVIDKIIDITLPKFEWRSRSVDHIMSLIDEYRTIRENHDYDHMKQQGFNSLLPQLTISLIILIVSENLVALITVTTLFMNVLVSLFWLFNLSVKFEDDYIRIREMFDKTTKETHLPMLPFDKVIEVTNYNITKEEFSLVMKGSLVLYPGKRILIRGASGEGKSTFIKALFGLEHGATLSHGLPGNYFGHVVQMYQSIKENFPVSNLTIRQVFDNEPNDLLIEYCLGLSCSGKWIDRKKNKISWPMTNYLDEKIDDISGGEKTRLAIAMLLNELIKTNKSILLLDEPEQGSDPPVAYQMIQTIINAFPDRMIIVISHLEKITEIGIKWNDIIHVNGGAVKVINIE